MQKLSKSNFNPNELDIFEHDSNGNFIYYYFGKKYTVNSTEQRREILNIEGYKPYILSTKPPIFIVLAVFSLLIFTLSSIMFPELESIKFTILYFSFFIYVLIVSFFYLKIYKILQGTYA